MIVWRPDPRYTWVGPGVFRGEILVDGEVKRTFFCKVQMEVYADVLVASTDIPRGKPISEGDVDVQKRALTAMRSDFLADPEDAVGLLARSTIFPGQVITKRNVIPPKLVKRYQVVSVETRAGALLVRGRARALADGRAGDIVPCRNEGSKEQFYGVVRDDGVIVVE
jgi:flagella basal body P-ring formation protein FlgA